MTRVYTPRPKFLGRRGSRQSLTGRMLEHLANEGPTDKAMLTAAMKEVTSEANVHTTLARMKRDGLIKHKVWLTAEGLAELRSMGWRPEMAGLAADVTEE